MTDAVSRERARSGAAPAAYGHFQSVHKSFTRQGQEPLVAIDTISFDIAAGKFISLLGPSGCGKTTFLHIIAGLISATSGTVQINGVNVTGPQPDFGIAFQQANLMPWRTVLKNVLFPIEIRREGGKESLERALELLSLVGLTGSNRPIQRNSPAACSNGSPFAAR